jgi:hypothetical protein
MQIKTQAWAHRFGWPVPVHKGMPCMPDVGRALGATDRKVINLHGSTLTGMNALNAPMSK